jgi:hypothetical protein
VSEFTKALEALINQYSKENISDTPDFILAHYLTDCLQVFNTAVIARERWYGRNCGFGSATINPADDAQPTPSREPQIGDTDDTGPFARAGLGD